MRVKVNLVKAKYSMKGLLMAESRIKMDLLIYIEGIALELKVECRIRYEERKIRSRDRRHLENWNSNPDGIGKYIILIFWLGGLGGTRYWNDLLVHPSINKMRNNM